jgi:hypothetical protein
MFIGRYRSVCSRLLVPALAIAAICVFQPPSILQAAGSNYYVAPNGLPTNDGTAARPLDLATALSASSPARAGDTIWLRGGVYSGTFTSNLNGAYGQPIIVRQYPGERATIDGAGSPNANTLNIKGSNTWYWGFEVTNSSTNRVNGASSRGEGIMQYGAYTKLINLVVHDAMDGIGSWAGVTDGEIYGNVIYNNGGESGGVGAGHSIYIQNSTGTKRVVDNVMSNSYNFGIHIYTEGGTIDNVSMEGNIAFNHGVLASSSSYKANYFVGGSKVAQDPTMIGNYGYYPFGSQGRNADLGWGTACNSLNMQDNYLAGGTSAKINCTSSTVTGNFFYGAVASSVSSTYPSNLYAANRPSGVKTVVRPNQYEPGRANIAVYNWDHLSSVSVDVSSAGLKSGDRFEIRDAQNFFGPAVVTGTYNGSPVTLPMTGLTPARPIGAAVTAPPTGPEFNAFVLLPTSGTSTPSAPTATLSASPSSVTSGQSSTLSWTTSNASTVSISPTVGSVAATGSVSVTPAQTTTYTLTASGSGGSVVKTSTVTVSPAGGGGGGGGTSATFVRIDTTTKGTWLPTYGKDGAALAGGATQYPAYAQVTFSGNSSWTWASSTSDTRALQNASNTGRTAATWYESGGPFTIDVNVTDGASHQLALYVLDWDNQGRAETIQLTNRASGAVLDQRAVSSAQNGVWVVWQISGSVRIKVLRTAGANAIVNGLFFGAGGSGGGTPPPTAGTASATFVKADTTTRGSWLQTYGKDGAAVAGNATTYPGYAKVTMAGASSWTWAASTADLRALQTASGAGRIAAAWFDSGGFTIDVNLTDGASHQVALYLLDWDQQGRAETVQITNLATGAVLDSRAASGFGNGTYLVWQLTGSVRIRVTRTQGDNAIVNGLFFN